MNIYRHIEEENIKLIKAKDSLDSISAHDKTLIDAKTQYIKTVYDLDDDSIRFTSYFNTYKEKMVICLSGMAEENAYDAFVNNDKAFCDARNIGIYQTEELDSCLLNVSISCRLPDSVIDLLKALDKITVKTDTYESLSC